MIRTCTLTSLWTLFGTLFMLAAQAQQPSEPAKDVDYLRPYSVNAAGPSSGFRSADGRLSSFSSLAGLISQVQDGVVVESLQLSVVAVQPTDWRYLRECRDLRLLAVYIPPSASPSLDSLLRNIAALPKLEAIRLYASNSPPSRPRSQQPTDKLESTARLPLASSADMPFPKGAFRQLRELELNGSRLPMEALIGHLAKGNNLQTVQLRMAVGDFSEALPRNLGSLPGLTSLVIDGRGWTGWQAAFVRLHQLKTLTLTRVAPYGSTRRADGPEAEYKANEAQLMADLSQAFVHLTALRQLTLSFMTGVEQLELRRLPALVDLRLEWTAGPFDVPLSGLNRLQRLEITDCSLTPFPNAISSLPSLTELRLTRNQLSALPADIGQLQRLQTLFITENPLKKMPEIPGGFPHLRSLTLRSCQLETVPNFIGQLPALHFLNLSHNSLDQLPASIGTLKQLDTLQLSANKLTSLPASVCELSNLNEMLLNSNQLDSLPADLRRLNRLHRLSVDGNRLRSLPESIGRLASLQWLSVVGNRLTALPESLGQMRQLRRLMIGGNTLTELPESIGQLPQLIELAILDSPLTKLPAALANLRKLETLSLRNTQLRRVPAWVGRLSHLEHITVESDELLTLPNKIGRLHRLKSLSIAGRQFRSLPEGIGNLQHLTFLHISGRQASAAGSASTGSLVRLPRNLPKCKALITLAINDQPKLDADAVFKQVVNMPSLRYVSLERDGISTLPSIDWQAIYWRSLRLAGNKLTSLPKALVAAPDMQMLDCKENPLPAPQNRSFHNNTMIREAVLSVR